MAKKKWSEEDIAYSLYLMAAEDKHKYAVSNSTKVLGYTGEDDFLSVNRKGMIVAYEIKTTNWDFKRDFMDRGNKLKRHKILSQLADMPMMQAKMPNYFYFVTPEGVVKLDEIPEYAGLIYVKEKFGRGGSDPEAVIIKKAPQLHDRIVTDRMKANFVLEMVFRLMVYSRKQYKAKRDGKD